MPSERQNIDIPLTGGLKEKTSPPWLDPSSMPEAINVIWQKRNALSKRFGFTLPADTTTTTPAALTGLPTSLSQPAALYPNGTGFTFSDGTYLFNRSDGVDGSNTWTDFAPQCVATRRIISDSQKVLNPDVAEDVANARRVFVWVDPSSTLYYSVIDTITGVILGSGVIDRNHTSTEVKVMTVNNFAIAAYVTAGGFFRVATLRLNTAIAPGANWAVSTLLSNVAGGWDVAPADNGSAKFAIFYESTASPAPLKVDDYSIDNAGAFTQLHTVIVAGFTSTGYLALTTRYDAALNSRIWFGFGAPGTSQYLAGSVELSGAGQIDMSPTELQAAGYHANNTIARSGIEVVGTQTICAVWTSSPAIFKTVRYVGWNTCVADGGLDNPGTAGTVSHGFNQELISRPFFVRNADTGFARRIYGWVATLTEQVSQVLVEFDIYAVESARPIAMVAPRLAYNRNFQSDNADTPRSNLSSVVPVQRGTATAFTAAGTYATSTYTTTTTANNLGDVACLQMTADFAHVGRAASAQVGGILYLGAGLPSVFDGFTLAETGSVFETPVLVDTMSIASGGAGNLAANFTYFYIFVYEWVDRQGVRIRGQPSPPVSFATGGTAKKANLVIPSETLTKKGLEYRRVLFDDSPQTLAIYRTAVISGAMSENYFLVDRVHNSEGTETTAYADNLSDAALVARETLYTTGGVLENDQPPSFAWITAHRNRVYGIGDDLRTVWISSEYQPGGVVTFTDGQSFTLDSLGDLTALWSMDEKLFIASATGIAYVVGAGPNAIGTQSDLSPPSILPTDVGVTDPRSIVITPEGTVFRHKFGLALLDRSLSVHSDFGDPVEDHLTTSPYVTCAALHPTRPEMLFGISSDPLANGNTSTGTVLSYNYRFGAWSEWQINDGNTVPGTLIPAAMQIAGSDVWIADGLGSVALENTLTNDKPWYDRVSGDFDTFVNITATSGWVKVAQSIGGFGCIDRFTVTWANEDWAGLSCSIGYDFDAPFTTPSSWNVTAAAISAFADVNATLGTETRMQFTPPRRQCAAFRVRVVDSEQGTTTTGQGFRIDGLSAQIAMTPGMNRLPAAQGV